MQIEHFAYMVADPISVAAWYVRHLGWQVRRSEDKSPYTHFLADSSGQIMVEIYNNPAAMVPDYWAMKPLILHIGLACGADLNEVRERLLTAGATAAGDTIVTPLGDRLAMLRDPWGLSIQLCNRKNQITAGV